MDYRTNTIAQLWNGHIEPIRHLGEDNPQIDQLKAFMKGTYEKLKKTLTTKISGFWKNTGSTYASTSF